MIREERKGQYVPVNTEITRDDDELTPEEQRFQAKLEKQYRDLALAGSVVEPSRYYFMGKYPLYIGIHVYGVFNALGFTLLSLMALIARGKSVRVWLDVIYVLGVFLPGICNYVPLVLRKFNLFWRQNVMLTAWYQVFISILLNIGAIINVLVRGNCRDPEWHDNFNECEDLKVIFIILIIIVFTVQIGFMVYLAMTASRFLKEYEDEHREELERQQRLLFKQNKSEMRNSIKEYVRTSGSDY